MTEAHKTTADNSPDKSYDKSYDKNDDRPEDKSYTNSLYPEDQKKVDEFITRGVNSVERKPFRPLLLMGMLVFVVTALSVLSQFLASWAGVY